MPLCAWRTWEQVINLPHMHMLVQTGEERM